MKGTPTLRFPQFEEGWRTSKTKELFGRIADRVNVKQEEFYQQIGIRSHGKGLFHKIPIQGKTLGNKRVFWIKNNVLIINIVFAWEQAVAKTTDEELGMVASHRFPMFEPKKTLADLEYFLWFFLTKRGKYLFELASPGGAGRNKTLGQKTFDELNVLHPTLVEQQEIASFLSTVEKKIQQLTRKKELLEQYKKGVMQKIFSQEIRFQDENGKDYPHWEEKRLGELGEFKTSSVDKKNVQGEEIINLVNYMNVYKHDEIKTSTLKNLMQVTANETQRKTSDLKKGDILFTPSSETANDIGHSVVIFEDLPNTLYSYHLLRFRPKLKLDILFCHYFCNIPYVLKQLSKYANGSTRFTISVNSFSKVQTHLPSLEEQNKIAEFLSKIDKKIESVQTQLTQTQTFKKGLLQQMFV